MTSFRFVSYREFKRELGKTNAAVECAELAVRRFLHEAEIAKDESAFVKAACEEYGVRVDTLDAPLLKRLLAQLHLTTVHQEFESFLQSMMREHRGKAVELEKGDSLLKGTLKGEEIPRLWRGGSKSLTFTGVHPRNSRREPTKAHVKEKPDGPIGESKSLSMGVQIPRIVYSQMPPPSAV